MSLGLLSHNPQPFSSSSSRSSRQADQGKGSNPKCPACGGLVECGSEMTTIIGFSDDQQIRFALQNERHAGERRRGVVLGKSDETDSSGLFTEDSSTSFRHRL
jgi:hypothetical protein